MLALRIIATVLLGIGILGNVVHTNEYQEIDEPLAVFVNILDFIAKAFVLVVVWVL